MTEETQILASDPDERDDLDIAQEAFAIGQRHPKWSMFQVEDDNGWLLLVFARDFAHAKEALEYELTGWAYYHDHPADRRALVKRLEAC